jgi:hypothetical protein
MWVAEFRGFFMGEGHVSIARRRAGDDRWVYRPELHINLRLDDRAVCDEISECLGGRVNVYKPSKSSHSKPQARWSIEGYKYCEAILELLRDGCLPAKKQREVALVLDFIAWRETQGAALGEEGRAVSRDYFEKLRAIRLFKSE